MKRVGLKGFVVLLFIVSTLNKAYCEQLNRTTFYKAMAAQSIEEVDDMLKTIKTLSFSGKDAFEGAMLMKKADLLKDKKQQLQLFKEGKTKLEKEIASSNQNCEYRLLRLMIQENAPSFLGYNKQIDEDVKFIRERYKESSGMVQNAAIDYSKHSKNLKLL